MSFSSSIAIDNNNDDIDNMFSNLSLTNDDDVDKVIEFHFKSNIGSYLWYDSVWMDS